MLTDKELKKKFLKEFQKNPDKFYPSLMKELGLIRKKCSCGKFFWSVNERKTCGDPSCSGAYTFIGKPIAKVKYDYIEVWQNFSKILKSFGYTPIRRYPVTARWREDIEFVEASIDDFIPYVINGEINPPANPLIVPQVCLRFNDIDNVGITGAHYSGFVMIGQHRFEKSENWNFDEYLKHLLEWFTKGLKIPLQELVLHEDVWAGSGNFGPCIEFFSGGLELANQVYMQFFQTQSGYEDLKLKVLDMGLGHERNAWFSSGKATSYETTFPTVVKELKTITGIKPEKEMIEKFLPYSSLLNVDEIGDAEKVWKGIAKKTGYDLNELRESIQQLAGLYSVAEHTRTLLVAISDGALPSNTGGGYNLRILLRRALSFIDRYEWDIDLFKICELHAGYLKPLFPELSKNLKDIEDILSVEIERFKATRKKSAEIIEKIMDKKIDNEKLIELYDSQGISPEMVEKEAGKRGIKIHIPENFYAKVAERHKEAEKSAARSELDLSGIPDTRLLFYEEKGYEFKAKILKIIDDKVILDQTLFYPESGGQEFDTGYINNSKVIDVQKQGRIVIHRMENINFKVGDDIMGKIDEKRRKQLAIHHTATHIVNAAAKKVLGSHIFQAGAKKTEEKAHLDITHYKSVTDEELDKIERVANDIVNKSKKVRTKIIPRDEAEKEYGFALYQGGAIPEKRLRIIEVEGVDTEACGGTHLENTKDVGKIILLSSERIQDGISRLNFVAGAQAEKYEKDDEAIIKEICKLLGVEKKDAVKMVKKLFERWKALKKRQESKITGTAEKLAEKLEGKFSNNILIEVLEGKDLKELQALSKILSRGDRIIILFGINEKICMFVSAGEKTDRDAGKIMKNICSDLNGSGGGSKCIAQGVGNKKDLEELVKKLRKCLNG